ncbi:MAG TPA: glutamine amidotransferase [Polyangiaceae bacterium]|nr:glutamine amidotransferase [Polyangiaceae bacterium]
MTVGGVSPSDDLGSAAVVAVLVVLAASLVLLVLETRHRERSARGVVVTGILALALLAGAILRPVRVSVLGTRVGPKVVVLVDGSRRLLIPEKDRAGTRFDEAIASVRALGKRFRDARVTTLEFGSGPATPLSTDPGAARPTAKESDLPAALGSITDVVGERPSAIVVVSDGRLSNPSGDAVSAEALGRLGVPVHTVAIGDRAPADASIRSVRAAGAAVAHQPLALTIEVGCSGGLPCKLVPVTVTELRSGVEPALLAAGEAKVEDGVGKLELSVTLDRAGARILQVSIEPPEGDEVPENDHRLLTFAVARDRVRLLHLAGRPTYDVRALRRWLKSDEAVDVVAFFILREGGKGQDDPNADERDLALIEFPVTELFTTHLPSFDAVILQDIDAVQYKLDQHLPRLARYVESGGGLIMVGGPSSFAGGNYARTPLDSVLPVGQVAGDEVVDPAPFTPVYTPAGLAAPVTRALRDLLGPELPVMHGTNLLGAVRPGAIVLLEHPHLLAGGSPMPVLALGEAGDGRAIALSVDDTHQLAFSELAAKVAGRAYGALWDGLLGWLMRDARYEAARVELPEDCVAGEPTKLRVTRLPGMDGPVEAWIEPLAAEKGEPVKLVAEGGGAVVDVPVPKLAEGGYTARVRVGASPPTRHDFACERGGPAWSDSRPDPERLQRIASVTGGRAVRPAEVESIPVPEATEVAAERHVTPVLPPWAWSLASAVVLGAHWVSRRRAGLS